VRCPIESQENLELLLDFGAERQTSSKSGAFEQHLKTCATCREALAGQQAVRSELDMWEAPMVSPSFNRQLYERLAQEAGWRERIADAMWRPLRVLLVWRGVPVAVAACLLVTAGIVFQQPGAVRQQLPAAGPGPRPAQVDTVKPEQVVHALDDLEMLGNFDRSVRAAGRSEL
jgi:hypothetical protein